MSWIAQLLVGGGGGTTQRSRKGTRLVWEKKERKEGENNALSYLFFWLSLVHVSQRKKDSKCCFIVLSKFYFAYGARCFFNILGFYLPLKKYIPAIKCPPVRRTYRVANLFFFTVKRPTIEASIHPCTQKNTSNNNAHEKRRGSDKKNH